MRRTTKKNSAQLTKRGTVRKDDISQNNECLQDAIKNYYEYISPQINRAVKNKSYFYNCYGKEEKFYIENQG